MAGFVRGLGALCVALALVTLAGGMPSELVQESVEEGFGSPPKYGPGNYGDARDQSVGAYGHLHMGSGRRRAGSGFGTVAKPHIPKKLQPHFTKKQIQEDEKGHPILKAAWGKIRHGIPYNYHPHHHAMGSARRHAQAFSHGHLAQGSARGSAARHVSHYRHHANSLLGKPHPKYVQWLKGGIAVIRDSKHKAYVAPSTKEMKIKKIVKDDLGTLQKGTPITPREDATIINSVDNVVNNQHPKNIVDAVLEMDDMLLEESIDAVVPEELPEERTAVEDE